MCDVPDFVFFSPTKSKLVILEYSRVVNVNTTTVISLISLFSPIKSKIAGMTN